MAFEFTKIDDNVSDEEFIIECRKQNYRKLELLLEERYGIEVLHHKGVYDLPSRDNAYSEALP